MDIDPEKLNVDPSFYKLWRAWVGWLKDMPYWDPYGAAFTLILAGIVSGYFLWKLLNNEQK
jgi:hypothetical protein